MDGLYTRNTLVEYVLSHILACFPLCKASVSVVHELAGMLVAHSQRGQHDGDGLLLQQDAQGASSHNHWRCTTL